MKKIFILLLVCLAVCMCGCQNQKVMVSPVTSDFCCDCTFEYQQEKSYASLSVKQNGDFLLEFNAPDSIKGLKFCWDNKGFSLSYNELKSNLSEAMLPQTSYSKAVKTVLETVRKQSKDISSDIKNITSTGQCEYGQYTVIFRADGFIKKITIETLGLQVFFSNCRYNF
ncbi:MAG: hypothetical protein Q4B04_03110 [bacterium]|nr:hypothetical protein [bacterium]